MSEVHKTEEETGKMWWRRTKWRKPPRVWYTTGKATPNLRGTVTAGPLRQERRESALLRLSCRLRLWRDTHSALIASTSAGRSVTRCVTPPPMTTAKQTGQRCQRWLGPQGGGENSDKCLTSAQDDTRHTVRD